MQRFNLSGRMRRILPRAALRVLRELAGLAEERGFPVYAVGGFVRDLLLGMKNLDIDLVIEGDAIGFAGYAAKKLNAALVTHNRFGTATLNIRKPVKGGSSRIDIATARAESYEHPAALPCVRPSSIRSDLYRRDFTINAMAVRIDKSRFGELLDPFGGRGDLKNKKIRVLHEKSFIDDPTRIFRVVRFEQRYDFKIERRTAELIKNAVKSEMFEKVSGERLCKEIKSLLSEKEPLNAIKRMRGLHELRFISPKVRFDSGSEKICRNAQWLRGSYKKYFVQKHDLDLWLVYFLAVIDKLTLRESVKVCGRFAMSRDDRMRISSCKRFEKKVMAVLSDRRPVKPSVVYRALAPLSYEALIFLTAKCAGAAAKNRVRDFLRAYSRSRLGIKGGDLKNMGVKSGPEFNRILKKTLYAKIDGKLKTRRDEILFARGIIGSA